MECEKRLTQCSSSHLYIRKGWEMEYVSNRLIGKICIKYKRRFGWTRWKERWLEAHNNKLLFYKYTKKRKRYKMTRLFFTTNKLKYNLGGLEHSDGFYTFTILENGKKKYMMRTSNKMAIGQLYPHLGEILG